MWGAQPPHVNGGVWGGAGAPLQIGNPMCGWQLGVICAQPTEVQELKSPNCYAEMDRQPNAFLVQLALPEMVTLGQSVSSRPSTPLWVLTWGAHKRKGKQLKSHK